MAYFKKGACKSNTQIHCLALLLFLYRKLEMTEIKDGKLGPMG